MAASMPKTQTPVKNAPGSETTKKSSNAKTKAETVAEMMAAGIAPRSFSIDVFCARHGLSGTTYRKMRDLGIGPKETRVLDRILITVEHENQWLAERTAASA